ncbi:MAG: hypothetical protein DMF56_09815 [Acidobacteria bacterium]|nr:MAG: hypothetical protein DMF56_09815 [Acidobacteriota bacterium]
MKKALALFAFVTLFAANAFATYVVVMKDGTHYNAKQKWTIVNGKALILLENGQSLQVDPNFIDVPKSEQLTKLGITSGGIVDLNTNLPPTTSTAPRQPSLGGIKLRTPQQQKAAQQQQASTPSPTASSSGGVSAAVIDKFERAYDNMSIFERKITSTGAHSIRAELTVDTEDRVFNAISATALLMVRIEDARIDSVELFMKTGVGGSAGRFQMSRGDAEALVNRTISQSDYFVRNVIY